MRTRRELSIVMLFVLGFFLAAFNEWPPVHAMMDWRAKRNARAVQDLEMDNYQIYDHDGGEPAFLSIDFRKGKHFWNPQIAIWLEDSSGNYLETLLVTRSTARGLFFAGRTSSNFRQADTATNADGAPTRRVDALPFWSHKRGVKYPDGFYSPLPSAPLPDGITGATPIGNFHYKSPSRGDEIPDVFRIRVEVNVAFDDNEYYSEYDFLEDTLYHSGTGLMGQPSVIYGTTVRKSDDHRYYLLALDGHGHHSGSTGELFPDTRTLTTAGFIVERIVVGINDGWYSQ